LFQKWNNKTVFTSIRPDCSTGATWLAPYASPSALLRQKSALVKRAINASKKREGSRQLKR
jgi:hypothetical protein